MSEIVSSPENEKYFAFTERKSGIHVGHPVLLRRASAVVTDVGRVAVDADVAADDSQLERTAKTCGPDALRLASSSEEANAS